MYTKPLVIVGLVVLMVIGSLVVIGSSISAMHQVRAVASDSAPGYNVELAGQVGGQSVSVAVSGSLAYVGIGIHAIILDVSTSTQPVMVGYSDVVTNYVNDIAIVGNHAYLLDGDLHIFDITNPVAPIKVGYLATPGDANSVKVAGTLAYIADGQAGLRIVNVADPAHPVLIGSYPISGIVWDAVPIGNKVYLAVDGSPEVLQVFDVSNPAAPVKLGAFSIPPASCSQGARDVKIVGNLAYLAAICSGLRIVNVSDPTAMVEVGSYPYIVYAHDVAVAGNYAYVADTGPGHAINVIDVSNPSQPFLASYIGTYWGPWDIAVRNNTAYAAAGFGGFRIFDVSNPTAPIGVSIYNPMPTLDHGQIAAAGNYGYVVNNGLHVFAPQSPIEVGSLHSPDWSGGYPTAVGDKVYVSSGGLHIVDVSNPAAPIEVGRYVTTTWSAGQAAIAGNYAVRACRR